MNTHSDKKKGNKKQSVDTKAEYQKKNGRTSSIEFVDNRPEAIAQRKLQKIASKNVKSPQTTQMMPQEGDKWTVGSSQIHGKGIMASNEFKPNEKVDVAAKLDGPGKVNISKDFGGYINHQSEAKANASVSEKGNSLILQTKQTIKEGSEITANYDNTHSYIANSESNYKDIDIQKSNDNIQNKTLVDNRPESIVQRKLQELANNNSQAKKSYLLQRKEKPTMQMKNKLNVNDDVNLEREADVMGDKALQMKRSPIQLLKTDSGIPESLLDFLGGVDAYHRIKQKHFQWISQAHELAHGSTPGTTGAEYTIDANTAKELIKILKAQGYVEGTGRRPLDEEHALSRAAIARQEEREEEGDIRDAGAVKQINKYISKFPQYQFDDLYKAMPPDIMQKGRKAQVKWLKTNYKGDD